MSQSTCTVPELEYLKHLVSWQKFKFALHLPGIAQSDIDIIKKHDDVDELKVTLYEKWLRVYPDASWRDVISALETVGENTIATELQQKFTATIQQSEEVVSEKNKAIIKHSFLMPPSQSSLIAGPCVPKDVVDDLVRFQRSYHELTQEVRKEVEVQVAKGSITVKSLVNNVIQPMERLFFNITSLKSVINTPDDFFDSILPCCNFLSCELIIMTALFLSTNALKLKEKANEYSAKIEKFKACTAVADLQRKLDQSLSEFKACGKRIKVKLENAWGPISLQVVEVLIETLFPQDLEHPAGLQWFKVSAGSVIIIFLVLEHMAKPLIESSKKKLEFMRLMGLISLRIGDESVVEGEENKLFTFENSLIEATVTDNIEVVEFLLLYIPVDVNVKNTTVSLINDANRDQLYSTESDVAVQLRMKIATYKLLLEDVEHELQQNSSLEESISGEFGHHFSNNFLNARLLADQSLQLSKSLSHRINQYNDVFETDKRRTLIAHWIKPLENQFPSPFPSSVEVVISLHSVWSSCSVWFIEQLVQLIFPSLYNEFQWFRVNNTTKCLQVVLLVHNSLTMTVFEQSVGMQQVTELLGVISLQVDELTVFMNNIKDYSFNKAINQAKKLGANEVLQDILIQVIQAPVDFTTTITSDANNNYCFASDPDSTSLMIACCNNNTQLVKLLLDHNADPNVVNRRKLTALMYSSGNSEIYQMLLDSGADIDMVTLYEATTMHYACLGGELKVVEMLLARHHDLLNMVNRSGHTPLIFASYNGHLAIVDRLLQEQIDPNIQDNEGWTPLMYASSNGHLAIVKRLLQEHADPNIQDNERGTSLMFASHDGCFEIVQQLLQEQADPNIQDNEGLTPLHLASFNGHLAIVERLLQEQANPNIKDNEGWTPLMFASHNGHLEIVKRLLQTGANSSVSANGGFTALSTAIDNNQSEIVAIFHSDKADANAVQ